LGVLGVRDLIGEIIGNFSRKKSRKRKKMMM
jgi:hypothetical protein